MEGRRSVTKLFVEQVEKIVGLRNVITDQEKMHDYSHDESTQIEYRRFPDIVVTPASTAQVAALLRLASEFKVPVTPRGGGTGLSGGCIPLQGGVVLSLERMNRVLEVDRVNQMAVVEAGVTLADFIAAAQEAGLAFPPHPGDESAQIGGLIATNAGGSRAVKYGVIRNYVRGLEVVLASGEIISLGGKIVKSSSGYNLLHLFVGSEGTLGVITRAVIQLLPAPRLTRSLVIPYDDLAKAIGTVPVLIQQKGLPLAVEFMEKDVIAITEDFLKKSWPSQQGKTDLLIILDAPSEAEMDRVSEEVAELCLERGALDIFVADTEAKQQQILEIRSKIYEAIKPVTVEILDIALPRSEIAAHVNRVKEIESQIGLWLPTFGHAGDGNVHTHITRVKKENEELIPLAESEWRPKAEEGKRLVYEDGLSRGGVISGEHGIGIIKKAEFIDRTEKAQVNLMRQVKKIFDPNGILNPGKVVG